MRYLMVCLGNICRSPMGEGLLRHKLKKIGSNSIVDSCGFEPYHVGDSPDSRAQKVMQLHGIDIGGLKARLFNYSDFSDFDIIFCMDDNNYSSISRMSKQHKDMSKVKFALSILHDGINISIPDPYYGGIEDFERTYEYLDAAIDAIISEYEK